MEPRRIGQRLSCLASERPEHRLHVESGPPVERVRKDGRGYDRCGSTHDKPVDGLRALLNLGANFLCLRLLMPYRNGDVNMSSAWECSRNDVNEGFAVIAAALAVWAFESGWPDLVIAVGLLVMFLRSAARVLRRAWQELHPALPRN